MNILYLTNKKPYPPNKGERIRSYNFLKYLSKNNKITLIYPSFNKKELQYDKKNGNIHQYYSALMKTTLQKLRCLLNPLKPIQQTYYYSKKLDKLIKKLIKKNHFDLIFASTAAMARYAMNYNTPKIIDFIDADSEKYRLYSKFCKFPLSLFYYFEHKKMAKFEKKIIKKFNTGFVTTEREKEALGNEKILVLPNGIDFDYFRPKKIKKEKSIMFTGSMDYYPNVDAVLHFYKNIFPLVKKEIPESRFYIVGRNPVKKIKKLARDKNVIVTGYVKDARDYLNKAEVSIAPMRIGMGIQNKVLEAMAMELPIVATNQAVTGIKAINNKDIIISPLNEFANNVIELFKNKGKREIIGKNARLAVIKYHNWNTNLKKLDEIIKNVKRTKH